MYAIPTQYNFTSNIFVMLGCLHTTLMIVWTFCAGIVQERWWPCMKSQEKGVLLLWSGNILRRNLELLHLWVSPLSDHHTYLLS
jgi:hypothetical protein